MTGLILRVEGPSDDGRMVAVVNLKDELTHEVRQDPDDPGKSKRVVVPRERRVTYWPELLQQWSPAAVQAHIIQLAADAQAAELARAAVLEPHQGLRGSAAAALVCREGHIGCAGHDGGEGGAHAQAE